MLGTGMAMYVTYTDDHDMGSTSETNHAGHTVPGGVGR